MLITDILQKMHLKKVISKIASLNGCTHSAFFDTLCYVLQKTLFGVLLALFRDFGAKFYSYGSKYRKNTFLLKGHEMSFSTFSNSRQFNFLKNGKIAAP